MTDNISGAWLRNNYVLTLEPDITKSLIDGDGQTYNLSLSTDQVAGLLLMGLCLFGSLLPLHMEVAVVAGNGSLWPVTPANVFGNHFIAQSPQWVAYLNVVETWSEYINKVAASSQQDGLIPRQVTMGYTCRFRTSDNGVIIFQFGSFDFINGAMSVCTWFGLDWSNWISDVHLGDVPQNITVAGM